MMKTRLENCGLDMKNERGPWMSVGGTRRFYPGDPRPEEVYIKDIAQALSKLVRFNGHARGLYTVAQHSVLCSRIVPSHLALTALLHDAAEAYIGDTPSPVKVFFPELKKFEKRIEEAIGERFGVTLVPLPKQVKEADVLMCAAEKRDLMPSSEEWENMPDPKDIPPIYVWDRGRAHYEFMKRYKELTT